MPECAAKLLISAPIFLLQQTFWICPLKTSIFILASSSCFIFGCCDIDYSQECPLPICTPIVVDIWCMQGEKNPQRSFYILHTDIVLLSWLHHNFASGQFGSHCWSSSSSLIYIKWSSTWSATSSMLKDELILMRQPGSRAPCSYCPCCISSYQNCCFSMEASFCIFSLPICYKFLVYDHIHLNGTLATDFKAKDQCSTHLIKAPHLIKAFRSTQLPTWTKLSRKSVRVGEISSVSESS